MKLSKERITTLSQALVDRLAQGGHIQPQANKADLVSALEQIITEELMVEDRLNEEVRQILKAYEAEIEKGNLDYHKMFHITKKQLVKDRGIIL
jgi:hypothetical protein